MAPEDKQSVTWPDGLTVRPMQAQDAPEAAAIESGLFSQPWSLQSFLDSLALEDALYVTALRGGKVIGYCGLRRSFDEAEITNVAVASERWGEGTGRRMLEHLFLLAREWGVRRFTLEVRAGNERAIRLYRSLGFLDAGIRPGFYEMPREDALIMWTPDPDGAAGQ